MKFFYDCEFIEDGRTIDLVSIGIVAEDGPEYYAVSAAFNHAAFLNNSWLVENVLPSLPYMRTSPTYSGLFLDYDHPDRTAVKPRWQIANDVRDFLLRDPDGPVTPELWAWYGAYDHLALCQLWGPMVSLPTGLPMWTNDLRQEQARQRLSDESMPVQADGTHNALADARFNVTRARRLGILP